MFNIGAFGGSGQDVGIGEAFFPEQPVTLSAATLPPMVCPPISPPILINPHEHRVVDTNHRDLVRVYVLGTSGFDVTQINPATVSLDGAKPIAHTTRHFPHSEFLNAVYVFVGKDMNLPAGYTTATFTAQTFSGQEITSSKQVLNIPFSARVPGRLHFLMDKGSAYPGLGRLNARQPGSVDLGNTRQPLPLVQSRSAAVALPCRSPASSMPTVKVPDRLSPGGEGRQSELQGPGVGLRNDHSRGDSKTRRLDRPRTGGHEWVARRQDLGQAGLQPE